MIDLLPDWLRTSSFPGHCNALMNLYSVFSTTPRTSTHAGRSDGGTSTQIPTIGFGGNRHGTNRSRIVHDTLDSAWNPSLTTSTSRPFDLAMSSRYRAPETAPALNPAVLAVVARGGTDSDHCNDLLLGPHDGVRSLRNGLTAARTTQGSITARNRTSPSWTARLAAPASANW